MIQKKVGVEWTEKDIVMFIVMGCFFGIIDETNDSHWL